MGYFPSALGRAAAAVEARKPPKPYEVSLYGTRDIIPPESNPERIRAFAPWWDTANLAAGETVGRLGEDYGGGLIDELTTQASDELARGGELSPDEVREATQGERAGWQARGLSMSAPAAFSEVLRRVQFSNARKAERRQFAGTVAGMGLARREANRAAAATATGASLAPTALGEEQRQYELQRTDNLRLLDKEAAVDLKIGRDSAAAAKKAQKSKIFSDVFGSIAGMIPFI